jgi:hypothetical protein
MPARNRKEKSLEGRRTLAKRYAEFFRLNGRWPKHSKTDKAEENLAQKDRRIFGTQDSIRTTAENMLNPPKKKYALPCRQDANGWRKCYRGSSCAAHQLSETGCPIAVEIKKYLDGTQSSFRGNSFSTKRFVSWRHD